MAKKIDFTKLFSSLQNNATMFPVIAEELATELGVTIESLNRLGVGFHFKYQAWAFAERDHKGNITGQFIFHHPVFHIQAFCFVPHGQGFKFISVSSFLVL